jgi:hypothetical protein
MRKFRILSVVLVGVSLALSVLVTGCASPGDMSYSGSGSAGSSTGGY